MFFVMFMCEGNPIYFVVLWVFNGYQVKKISVPIDSNAKKSGKLSRSFSYRISLSIGFLY